MLEFCKKVLRGVSFDPDLFQKELRKAKGRLREEERERLRHWSLMSYGHHYRDAIEEVFRA